MIYSVYCQAAFSGVEALIDATRRKPNIKNRVEEAMGAAVTSCALEQPAFGQVRVSNELRKRSIFASPSSVRSIWLCRIGELLMTE